MIHIPIDILYLFGVINLDSKNKNIEMNIFIIVY